MTKVLWCLLAVLALAPAAARVAVADTVDAVEFFEDCPNVSVDEDTTVKGGVVAVPGCTVTIEGDVTLNLRDLSLVSLSAPFTISGDPADDDRLTMRNVEMVVQGPLVVTEVARVDVRDCDLVAGEGGFLDIHVRNQDGGRIDVKGSFLVGDDEVQLEAGTKGRVTLKDSRLTAPRAEVILRTGEDGRTTVEGNTFFKAVIIGSGDDGKTSVEGNSFLGSHPGPGGVDISSGGSCEADDNSPDYQCN